MLPKSCGPRGRSKVRETQPPALSWSRALVAAALSPTSRRWAEEVLCAAWHLKPKSSESAHYNLTRGQVTGSGQIPPRPTPGPEPQGGPQPDPGGCAHLLLLAISSRCLSMVSIKSRNWGQREPEPCQGQEPACSHRAGSPLRLQDSKRGTAPARGGPEAPGSD